MCLSLSLFTFKSPDGRLLGVGGIDGTVHMFDIESGKIVQTHEGEACIQLLHFAQDGDDTLSCTQPSTSHSHLMANGPVQLSLMQQTFLPLVIPCKIIAGMCGTCAMKCTLLLFLGADC